MTFATLLVDDEPLAHEVLLHHCRRHADIEVVARCYSATEALAWLARRKADLIFLDIQMPALSGLEMLRVLANRPQVVICSAHHAFALEGFDLDVTDYLLKPISGERFDQAMDKVRRRVRPEPAAAEPVPRGSLVIRVDREDRKVSLDRVACFEGYGNFVKVWQGTQYLLTAATLKKFAATLPRDFVQIHKSVLVNRTHVVAVDHERVSLSNGLAFRIGRAYRANAAALLRGPSPRG